MSQPALQVSVVAATHNRPARLTALLGSLRSQTLAPARFEVVIVDDASERETAELLERERDRGGLVLRVLRRERSGGPAAARNDGWRAAAAPLVAFIDDDCVAAPEWLEEGLRTCAENPGAIVQGRVDPIPAERASETPFTRTLRIHAAGPYYQTCNIFYPRRLLDELHGFDDQSFTMPGGEDTDLAWRAISRGTPTAFAATARVYHAVNRIGPLGRLRVAAHWHESLQVYKRYPELRREVFLKGIFWKPWHYTFLRALLALVLPRRLRHLRVWLTLPYVASIETRVRFEGGSLRHAFFYPIEDVVEITAAVRASVRYRMLVL
jgi:glycosyltransferase involved in cell wall biosynthesis